MEKIIFGLCIVSSIALYAQERLPSTVEHALRITLAATDTIASDQGDELARQAFQKVIEGNYEASLSMVLEGIEMFPSNFILQANLASLLGDYAGSFSGALHGAMINRSQQIFNKLMSEVEGQHPADVFYLKNEYFFRFRLYKEQYELGLEKIAYYQGTEKWNSCASSCYYTQGVGAAQYARELLLKGNKSLAFDYAQKAIIAWAQHFSYSNSYYNSYVHYALALGILGYKDEMMKALQRSADLIKKDLSFNEFREVVEFIEAMEA